MALEGGFMSLACRINAVKPVRPLRGEHDELRGLFVYQRGLPCDDLTPKDHLRAIANTACDSGVLGSAEEAYCVGKIYRW